MYRRPAAIPVSTRRVAATIGGTDLPLLPYETMTLPNGLEVILSQDQRLPVVAVNIWYHVGPATSFRGARDSRTCSST